MMASTISIRGPRWYSGKGCSDGLIMQEWRHTESHILVSTFFKRLIGQRQKAYICRIEKLIKNFFDISQEQLWTVCDYSMNTGTQCSFKILVC